MIQRIQTLYLFAAAALMVTALLTPLAYFAAGTDEYTLALQVEVGHLLDCCHNDTSSINLVL